MEKIRCRWVGSASFLVGMFVLFAWNAAASNKMDMEAVMRRLEELQAVVQKQQAEIAHLKNMLNTIRKTQEQAGKQPESRRLKAAARKKTAPKENECCSWTDWLRLSADFRLRYESRFRRKQDGVNIEDRHRFRIRLRGYADSTITDEIGLHLMLTTGESGLGRSGNQTLGDEMDNKVFWIGRAYLKYRPKWFPGLELGGGKFKNPFVHTNITWDSDVNPEGFYEMYRYGGWESLRPFVCLGQVIISENNLTRDAALFLQQGGVYVRVGGVRGVLAGSFYNYVNLQRSRLGDTKRAGGNTTVVNPDTGEAELKYDFRVAEVFANLRFQWDGLPLGVWGNYLWNTASGVPDGRDKAWGVGIYVGRTRKMGDWKFQYCYKRIESDAVLGLISTGNFYGTDRVGHTWQVKYHFLKPLYLAAAFFETDSIEGGDHENRFQLDTIFKF